MENNKKEEEISKIIEEMLTKESNVTSDDGKVTLYCKGVGLYTDIKINCFLEETTKEELEKDIMNCLQKSKELLSGEITDIITSHMEPMNDDNEDNDQDEYGVTIENVS